jgi:hypothetical protein
MTPSTRQELIDYCLRKLGHPVIEINVAEEQVEDRVDEALQFYSEYHFDGVEKVYLKYAITQDDINNGYISMTYDASRTFTSSPGVSGHSEGRLQATESGVAAGTYVNMENLITSVTKIWHFSQSSIGMFDVRYQYALNDLYAFGSIDLVNYTVTNQYLSLLRDYLSPEKTVRFSRKQNRLYIDMKWSADVRVGSIIIIEAYRIIDPQVFPEVYNDMFLKQYTTALIKQQWGANLSKFASIPLPGNLILNGPVIYAEATAEVNAMRESMQRMHEGPPEFFMG